jgi:hypothetical protein
MGCGLLTPKQIYTDYSACEKSAYSEAIRKKSAKISDICAVLRTSAVK